MTYIFTSDIKDHPCVGIQCRVPWTMLNHFLGVTIPGQENVLDPTSLWNTSLETFTQGPPTLVPVEAPAQVH